MEVVFWPHTRDSFYFMADSFSASAADTTEAFPIGYMRIVPQLESPRLPGLQPLDEWPSAVWVLAFLLVMVFRTRFWKVGYYHNSEG